MNGLDVMLYYWDERPAQLFLEPLARWGAAGVLRHPRVGQHWGRFGRLISID